MEDLTDLGRALRVAEITVSHRFDLSRSAILCKSLGACRSDSLLFLHWPFSHSWWADAV